MEAPTSQDAAHKSSTEVRTCKQGLIFLIISNNRE
jgi:hypothetical protein